MSTHSAHPSTQAASPGHFELLEVLADEQRREVVRILARRPGPISRDAMARHVRGAGETVDHETTRATRLHHCDLPKLAEYDVVAYDAEQGVVTAGPVFEAARDAIW